MPLVAAWAGCLMLAIIVFITDPNLWTVAGIVIGWFGGLTFVLVVTELMVIRKGPQGDR